MKLLEHHKFFAGVRVNQVNLSSYRVEPPTFFDISPFYAPFQEIIDTYGVPRYKEANPGLFAVVWFPYMFGTMFGDFGHGSALLILALLLYLNEKSFPEQVVNARSLLLFLSIFSVYCGLIYNDFLSVPLPFFRSCYEEVGESFEKRSPNCNYPIGFDYNWNLSGNQITFVNSFKMKISIVIGVLHMTIGIVLKGLNALHFKEGLVFWFEFLPQLIFFMCTFGYMVLLVVLKWFKNYADNPSIAPSIISLYINFVQTVDEPLFGDAATQLKV